MANINLPHKQRGTVLITVVLIAAFVIVLVVESIKTVKYQKQLSNNLIYRDQAYSYLMGMEELAKILLKRAFEATDEDVVHLNQPWAQDDITFPIDGGMMTATIRDMQSCFNLNSVTKPGQQETPTSGADNSGGGRTGGGLQPVSPNPAPNPTGQGATTPGLDSFTEIISNTVENTEIQPDELAIGLQDWIDEDIEPFDHRGAEDDYYLVMDPPYRTPNAPIAHISELITVKGFSAKMVNQLKPYICVLPDKEIDQINVNTVDEENALVIYSIVKSNNVKLSDVKQALSSRPEEGYEDVNEFIEQISGAQNAVGSGDQGRLSVTSSFFEVSAQAEIGGTRVAMKTLFERDGGNNFNIVSRYFGRE